MVIFGDGGVGKTSLVNRYLKGSFVENTLMTIGVDFHAKELVFDGKKIALQIWDFAGEDRFRFLLPSYVRGSAGAIFMYDITRYASIKSFSEWMGVIRQEKERNGSPIPIVMVGGKIDLDYKRSISFDEAKSVANRHRLCGCIECSAKTGYNVELIFETITRAITAQKKR